MATLGLVAQPAGSGESARLSAARDELQALLARVDGSFDEASGKLGNAVDRVAQVIAALRDIAAMFDGGVGSDAVEGLRKAADSLLAIRAVVTDRSGDIAEMREAASALASNSHEVVRCLQVLEVYGMYVKIAAAGLPQFVEFADVMRAKLEQGEKDLCGLGDMLDALDKSLSRLGDSDKLLVGECARIVPQVPDALKREADNLHRYHAGLVVLAKSTSDGARAIESELHVAIQAIQIGDRVRQRLEHAVAGLTMAQEALAGGRLTEADLAPFVDLLAALCNAAATEYDADSGQLRSSLDRLRAKCDALASLPRAGAGDGEHDMLGRIEASVAEAHAMMRQLDRSNRESAVTLEIIPRAVDALTERAQAITTLRLDVQHMAINIGLRCRTAQQVARPVMVIASEIRTHASRLDAIAGRIVEAQSGLSRPCARIRQQAGGAGEASGAALSRCIATIGDCGERQAAAMADVDEAAGAMRGALADAVAALGHASDCGSLVHELAEGLRPQGSAAQPQEAEAALSDLFERLGRVYTMAEERGVHNRCLPPGVPPLVQVQAVPAPEGDDEDDGLF